MKNGAEKRKRKVDEERGNIEREVEEEIIQAITQTFKMTASSPCITQH